MATKIFKNGVFGFVLSPVWAVIKFVMALIIAVVGLICVITRLITSPLWFPVMIARNADKAARGLNDYVNSYSMVPAWLDRWLACVRNCCIYYLMRWLWTPIIACLPMRYRREFIEWSEKPLHAFSTKTQVAYYKTFCEEGKRNLLGHGDLSAEALAKIWEDESERETWIGSDRKLSKEQIEKLINGKTSSVLRRYFKRNTPDKEMMNFLISKANQGYGNALSILLDLIKRQRPSGEILNKLLWVNITDFQKKVSDIIDQYADVDAVEFSTAALSAELSEDEKKAIVREAWFNFCKSKKDICLEAQRKMNCEQYEVFAETGHQLDYAALQSLCSRISDEKYLKAVVEHEYEQIDARLVTALKSEYWRYRTYLAVKQERETANK
jgi:hypothetical protein